MIASTSSSSARIVWSNNKKCMQLKLTILLLFGWRLIVAYFIHGGRFQPLICPEVHMFLLNHWQWNHTKYTLNTHFSQLRLQQHFVLLLREEAWRIWRNIWSGGFRIAVAVGDSEDFEFWSSWSRQPNNGWNKRCRRTSKMTGVDVGTWRSCGCKEERV